MYVTIPIMQFALLFLSLERLSKHFNLSMTWAKIFTKPYLIQMILCATWIVLIALLATFMFVKKQFSFTFIKDKAYSLAPPILGDVASKLASRRHHCSIDGRLSSVFKTVIIILFVILIVKPILFSLGFNLLSPFCCKGKRKEAERKGDRRTTRLVTIFLLLNLFFSFPFYFASMFNSILTRIDKTRDTFTLILKICFILRITNIIFECLAFYIFERNSWSCISKICYYGTCKKCPIFKSPSDDDAMYTKDPDVQDLINETRNPSDDDDEEPRRTTKKKKKNKKIFERVEESEPDDDDDGSFKKTPKKNSIVEGVETPVESNEEDEEHGHKGKKSITKKTVEPEEDEDEVEEVTITTRKSKPKEVEHVEDEEEEEPKRRTTTKRKPQIEKVESAEEDDEKDEPKQTITTKHKSQTKRHESDDNDDETKHVTTKRKSHSKHLASDDEEVDKRETTKRKSRKKHLASDDDDAEKRTTIKRKSHPKVEEQEEEVTVITRPKSKSTKSRHDDDNTQIPNGKSTAHRSSSATKRAQRHSVPAHVKTNRRSIQPAQTPDDSEADAASNASHASSKIIKPSASPKPKRKQTTKVRPTSTEQKRSRTVSPNDPRSRHRTDTSQPTKKHSHSASTKAKKKTSSSHTKKPKKDSRVRILEMSDDV